jgi:hypothetical protein
VTLVTQRSSPQVCSIVESYDYSSVPQCADAPWMLLSDYADVVGKACREGYGGLNEEGALAPV